MTRHLGYEVWTWVDGRPIRRQPVGDPFHATIVTVGRRDLLRGLFSRRGSLVVRIQLRADVAIVDVEHDAPESPDRAAHPSAVRPVPVAVTGAGAGSSWVDADGDNERG